MRRERRPRRVGGVVIVLCGAICVSVGGSVAGGGTDEAAAQEPCEQPYAPWYEANLGIYDENPLADVLVNSLDASEWLRPLDSDGDGRDDVIENVGDTVTITRGDGQVRLTPPAGATVGGGMSGGRLGDLNGDGRDEIRVSWSAPVPGDGFSFLVDGTVRPGTHSVADVGVRMPESLLLAPVGDQDGVPGIELAAGNRSEQGVVSGRELLAPGPGGVLAAWPPRVMGLPGLVLATVDSGETRPTIVTRDDANPNVTLVVLTEERIAVRTDIESLNSPPGNSPPGAVSDPLIGDRVELARYGSDRILVADSGFSRSGTTLAAWNLDDPCSRFDPASDLGPSARGAVGVAGDPTYTG